MLNYLLILGSLHFVSVAEGWGLDQKTWTYEMISAEASSADTDLLNLVLTKERISRGVYAISGEMFFKFDIVEGDGNTFSVKIYRSVMGDGDYKLTPFSLPSTHWIDYMNTHYKNIIMESVKNCSNLPYIEDKMVGPFVAKQYIVNKCMISQDGLPQHLQEGMYKIEALGTGTVNWKAEIILNVQPNV